jgi:hypothetical protein
MMSLRAFLSGGLSRASVLLARIETRSRRMAKQYPHQTGDCFATSARNDVPGVKR